MMIDGGVASNQSTFEFWIRFKDSALERVLLRYMTYLLFGLSVYIHTYALCFVRSFGSMLGWGTYKVSMCQVQDSGMGVIFVLNGAYQIRQWLLVEFSF